jgi:hypothetical protein
LCADARIEITTNIYNPDARIEITTNIYNPLLIKTPTIGW